MDLDALRTVSFTLHFSLFTLFGMTTHTHYLWFETRRRQGAKPLDDEGLFISQTTSSAPWLDDSRHLHALNREWSAPGLAAGGDSVLPDQPILIELSANLMVRGVAREHTLGEEAREMTDQVLPHLADELGRLRRLRDATLRILRHEGLSHEEKLHAIKRAFENERDEGERDEDAEAGEARDRERLS